MISRRKRIPVFCCLLLCGIAAACNSARETPTGKRQAAQAATSMLDTAATAGFSALLYHYYDLKNALSFTNSTAADKAARAMQLRISNLRRLLPAGQDSLQLQLDTINTSLAQLLAATNKDCEAKRIYFKPVSAALYDALKSIRIKNLVIYHTFCPMAFREKGAFWLSEFPEIRNPYFGAKMIECGEVIDTIR